MQAHRAQPFPRADQHQPWLPVIPRQTTPSAISPSCIQHGHGCASNLSSGPAQNFGLLASPPRPSAREQPPLKAALPEKLRSAPSLPAKMSGRARAWGTSRELGSREKFSNEDTSRTRLQDLVSSALVVHTPQPQAPAGLRALGHGCATSSRTQTCVWPRRVSRRWLGVYKSLPSSRSCFVACVQAQALRKCPWQTCPVLPWVRPCSPFPTHRPAPPGGHGRLRAAASRFWERRVKQRK